MSAVPASTTKSKAGLKGQGVKSATDDKSRMSAVALFLISLSQGAEIEQ
jgi:hypothetical protein